MRRRIRRKYTWFPVRGTAGPPETNDDFSGIAGQVSVAPTGATNITFSPLVPDVPMEGDTINATAPGQLVQALGQEYVIERIVGKCFVSVAAPADDAPATTFPKSVLVGCGIFVARADDAGGIQGAEFPIGAASGITEAIENYSPLGVDVIREPWLWRRTWVLSTGRVINGAVRQPGFANTTLIQAGTGLAHIAGAPNTNVNCGSVMDGPHVDAKSVRRVGNDERLYFVIAARTLDLLFPGDFGPPNTLAEDAVSVYFDYRVLGQLRKARNRSNF